MFRGLICAQSAFHMFFPCFLGTACSTHTTFCCREASLELFKHTSRGGLRSAHGLPLPRWATDRRTVVFLEMDPATIATFITGSGLSHLYTTFTPLAALALSLMPWTCSRGRTTQWSNHVPVCFSSRFQLCGFAQRPWADQFCEFGCGTRLVKKDISVSEEGKPNKFATVHQLETYTAPLGIHIPQSGKKQFISWSFWTKTHRTGILVDFWAVERHQIHRRLRLHLHQWHHWTAKGTTVGRSNYLKSLDFVDILRIFEGKINSSPQCFLFKCFHIYVLAWFHKFQREGLLRVYLMTNMTSVLLNLRSAPPLKPPWTPPFIQFYSILLICSKNGCSFWSPWQAAKVTHARMYGLGGIGRLLGLGPGRWSLVDWSGQNITVLLSTLEGAV